MMNNKRKQGLKQKLKDAVEHIATASPYENKISGSILDYLNKAAIAAHVPQGQLHARITLSARFLCFSLYHKEEKVKELSVKELICLFAGSDFSGLWAVEKHIISRISIYIFLLSENHTIPIERLGVYILAENHQVRVASF